MQTPTQPKNQSEVVKEKEFQRANENDILMEFLNQMAKKDEEIHPIITPKKEAAESRNE